MELQKVKTEGFKLGGEELSRLRTEIKKFSLVRTAAVAILVLTLPMAVVLVQQQTKTRTTAAGEVQTVILADNLVPIFSSGVIGDLDGDGCVSLTDFRVLEPLYGKKVVKGLLGDINGDGIIDSGDINVWLSHFGEGCKK